MSVCVCVCASAAFLASVCVCVLVSVYSPSSVCILRLLLRACLCVQVRGSVCALCVC